MLNWAIIVCGLNDCCAIFQTKRLSKVNREANESQDTTSGNAGSHCKCFVNVMFIVSLNVTF